MIGRVYTSLIFFSLISLGLTEYAYIEETNTHQLDQNSFWNIAHKISKHVIIELYTSAAWCMHCRTLHPVFRNVAKKYRENKDIMFARMDLGEFKPLDLKIIGYPSIKVFKRGNEEVDYWGDNNDEDISDFIESNLLRNTSEL